MTAAFRHAVARLFGRRPKSPAAAFEPPTAEYATITVYLVRERGRTVAEYRNLAIAEAHARRLAGDSWFGARVYEAERRMALAHVRAERGQAQADALEERRAAHMGEPGL